MQRSNGGIPQREGHVVYCEKCKKIGLFEKMSPYGRNWFTRDVYKHKDCGGKLWVMLNHLGRSISTEEWQSMPQDEKEKEIQQHWETQASAKCAHEEYEARMNAMSYEERKALDKEISDFRKYNYPNLTCPMCGSHVVKKLTVADRAVSVAAWGLASGKCNGVNSKTKVAGVEKRSGRAGKRWYS